MVDLDQWCSYSKDEYKEILSNLLQFSFEFLGAIFFLLLDHIIVQVMLSVQAHSNINYVQKGEHSMKFNIEGTGLLAKLLRVILRNFNMHERVYTNLSNETCLPYATVLPTRFYIKLSLIYISIIILIYKSTYILRLRRLVCAWFYRKREKRRILYLYNNIRRQRRSIIERMNDHVKTSFVTERIRAKLNPLLRLRLKCPQLFNWLKFFRIACRKCLVCESLEGIDMDLNIHFNVIIP